MVSFISHVARRTSYHDRREDALSAARNTASPTVHPLSLPHAACHYPSHLRATCFQILTADLPVSGGTSTLVPASAVHQAHTALFLRPTTPSTSPGVQIVYDEMNMAALSLIKEVTCSRAVTAASTLVGNDRHVGWAPGHRMWRRDQRLVGCTGYNDEIGKPVTRLQRQSQLQGKNEYGGIMY